MTTPTPDAYLLPDTECDEQKLKFINHITDAPIGSKVPFMLNVQWVDSAGNPTKEGRISGTIETIIELDGEEPIVVYSTGERISLETFRA